MDLESLQKDILWLTIHDRNLLLDNGRPFKSFTHHLLASSWAVQYALYGLIVLALNK